MHWIHYKYVVRDRQRVQAPNGWRWWRVGGTRLAVETGKTEATKKLKNAARTYLSTAGIVGQLFTHHHYYQAYFLFPIAKLQNQ